MRIGIHQANFIPWFPFFYKMSMCDVFVLMRNVQFEKNGFQNRFHYKGKWITKPVSGGVALIKDKTYADMTDLSNLNRSWIEVIADTLGIDTDITWDDLYAEGRMDCTPTWKLIDILKSTASYYKHDGQIIYVTNPEAKDKYLDEDLMRSKGIDIEYCKVPKNLQKHTFEIMEEFGIEGAIKQLPKRKQDAVATPVLQLS